MPETLQRLVTWQCFTNWCYNITCIQFLLTIFDDCQLFVGEGYHICNVLDDKPPCALILAQTEADGSIYLYYWRDGLEEEKAVRFLITHCLLMINCIFFCSE